MHESTRSIPTSAVQAAALASLLVLAGCATAPMRHVTLPLDVSLHQPAGELVAPVPIKIVAPKFPWQLVARGIEGRAFVLCHVDENGAVRETRAINNGGFEELGHAAAMAVAQWTFRPGTRDGRNAAMWIEVPFMFKFEPGDSGFMGGVPAGVIARADASLK